MREGDWIMVLEDDPALSSLITEFVQLRTGGTVLACTSGNEARAELAARNPPSILFSDILMPGGSGIDVARTVRDMQGGDHTRIIIISGVLRDRIADQLTELDIFEYLEKPVSPDRLMVTLERALAG